jgi:Peptidase family S41
MPYFGIRMRILAWLTLGSCVHTATSQPLTERASSHRAAAVAMPTFDRQPWLDDYAGLRAQMESSYANLTWFASPEGGLDLPELHGRTLAALESAPNAAAAEAAIEAFVSAFHDGHFSRLPRVEQNPSAPKPPAFFPDRSLPPALGCGALGYARTRGVAFSVRFEASPGFRLLSAGEPESFRTGIASLPDGRTLGVLRIPSFRDADFVAECEQAWSEMARAKGAGACNRECQNYLDHRAMQLALSNLQMRIRELARVGVVAAVVDLGGNGGGNDLGDWAPRAFTRAAVHSARLGLVRHAKSAAYYEEQLELIGDALRTETSAKSRDALIEAQREYERLDALSKTPPACSMSWVWRERRPWSPAGAPGVCTNLLFGRTYASGAVDYMPPGALGSPKAEEALYWPAIASSVVGSWTGPVYVIMDGDTASAAEIAAAVFQDNGIARLVGARTKGLGCGFMYKGSEYTVPHAGLRYRIPNCIRLRADGSNEVAGIRPDVAVPTYEGEPEPDRAVRFLEAVGHDLLDMSRGHGGRNAGAAHGRHERGAETHSRE